MEMDYYGVNDYRSYLSHHGILGQKWGVRRFQKKDGTLTADGRARLEQNKEFALKARAKEREGSYGFGKKIDDDSNDLVIRGGKNLYRVGGENESNTGSTYAVTREDDYKRYEEAASQWNQQITGNTKYTFIAKNEMKFAGARAQMNAILEVYGSMPQKEFVEKLGATGDKTSGITKEYVEYDVKRMFDERPDDGIANSHSFDSYKKRTIGDGSDRDFINDDDQYRKFTATIPKSPKLMNKYISELKKNGYNAVFDDNSRDVADTPFIVFDQKALTQVGSKQLKVKKDPYKEKI